MADATLDEMIDEVQRRLGDDGTAYTDELVQLMISAGLQFLFPKFYVVEAVQLVVDGNRLYELTPTIGDEVAAVIDVYETES